MEEEEIGSKWRDRERLLFSCANDEVCRAMKCELVRSCCALEQKICVVLESNLRFREGWGAGGKNRVYRHKDGEG